VKRSEATKEGLFFFRKTDPPVHEYLIMERKKGGKSRGGEKREIYKSLQVRKKSKGQHKYGNIDKIHQSRGRGGQRKKRQGHLQAGIKQIDLSETSRSCPEGISKGGRRKTGRPYLLWGYGRLIWPENKGWREEER